MIVVFVIVFCAIVALGFGAAAAWSDYTRLTIPNIYAALIGASFVPAFVAVKLLTPEAELFYSWSNHLISFVLVFAITYALFFFKKIGGGDAKLLSVYALWIGLNGLMPLLLFMALTGGILGLATLKMNKKKLVENPAAGGWIAKAQGGAQDLPYGVAIFVGAVFAFWQNGYLQPAALMDLASAGAGV